MPEQLITTVSTKGQVILPKAIRRALRWEAGTRLVVGKQAGGRPCSNPSLRLPRPDRKTYSDALPVTARQSPWQKCRPVFWPKPGGAMRAIDTNVLVRYLTGDEPGQAARARAAIDAGNVFVSTSVLLESEWVLRSVYGFAGSEVAAALRAFSGLPGVAVENPALLIEALDLTRRVWTSPMRCILALPPLRDDAYFRPPVH